MRYPSLLALSLLLSLTLLQLAPNAKAQNQSKTWKLDSICVYTYNVLSAKLETIDSNLVTKHIYYYDLKTLEDTLSISYKRATDNPLHPFGERIEKHRKHVPTKAEAYQDADYAKWSKDKGEISHTWQLPELAGNSEMKWNKTKRKWDWRTLEIDSMTETGRIDSKTGFHPMLKPGTIGSKTYYEYLDSLLIGEVTAVRSFIAEDTTLQLRNKSELTYDSLGQLLSERFHLWSNKSNAWYLKRQRTIKYNEMGQELEMEDFYYGEKSPEPRSGKRLVHQYNDEGQVLQTESLRIQHDSLQLQETITFGYNPAGLLIRQETKTPSRRSEKEQIYTYDDKGNLSTHLSLGRYNLEAPVDTLELISYKYLHPTLDAYTNKKVATKNHAGENRDYQAFDLVLDKDGNPLSHQRRMNASQHTFELKYSYQDAIPVEQVLYPETVSPKITVPKHGEWPIEKAMGYVYTRRFFKEHSVPISGTVFYYSKIEQ